MTTDETLAGSAHGDAARELAFRRSLRASQARRAAAAATRRWSLRRRTTVILAAVAATGLAGGAVAQQQSSTGAAPTAARAALQAGASGAAVRALQLKLGIPADGVFGAQTRRAVRAFQERNHLQVDGVAGPETLGALGLARLPVSDETRARAAGVSTVASTTLERIAQCESGGNPGAISAGGHYRGKYQFDRATWRELGGSGDPAKAPEAEQDRRAAQLLAQRGTDPWPVCG